MSISKVANVFSGGLGLPEIKGKGKAPAAKPGAAPAAGGSGVARQRTAPSGGRPTDEERHKVKEMQTLIKAFSKALNSNPSKLQVKVNLPQLLSHLGNIGEADGVLGRNTANALIALNNIAAEVNLGSEIVSKTFRELSDKEVIALADKNTSLIASLMNKTGYGDAIPSGISIKPEVYDTVPTMLLTENVNSYSDDGVVVKPEHLANIRNFIDFVDNNLQLFSKQSSERISLQKAAQLIKESTIIRLSQFTGPGEAAANSARVSTVNMPEEPVPAGLTVGKIDQVFKWFKERVNGLFQRNNAAYQSGETARGSDKLLVSKQDLDATMQYAKDLNRLERVWKAQRDRFIKDGQDAYMATLSVGDLSEFKNPNVLPSKPPSNPQPTGAARQRPAGQAAVPQDMDGGFSMQGRTSLTPPITYKIDLENLPKGSNEKWDFINEYVAIHSFNINDFRSRSAKNLADYYMNEAARRDFKNPGIFVERLVFNLQQIFKEVLVTWRSSAQDKLPDFQNHWNDQIDKLSKWNYTLGYAGQKAKDMSLALGSGGTNSSRG